MTDETLPLCPGCGCEMDDPAEVDVLCYDCQPEPEEDIADNYCYDCAGSGEGRYDGTVCWRCNGRGVINRHNEREEL